MRIFSVLSASSKKDETQEPDIKKDKNLEPAIELIKKWEGFRSKAYRDPVGIWTIGYGTIKYPDGTKVNSDDAISERTASKYLMAHVESDILPYVDRYVKVPLNNNQYCALVSFTYNLGAGALRKSTLLKKINNKDFNGAAREFDRWVYAGGKKLRGLVRRRNDEEALFLTPVEGKVIGLS